MHFPRKFSAVPLFGQGRNIPPSRPNPDTPLRTATVENVLRDSDPSGGRKAHSQLHALSSTPARILASLWWTPVPLCPE
jgi:hypothetical protein